MGNLSCPGGKVEAEAPATPPWTVRDRPSYLGIASTRLGPSFAGPVTEQAKGLEGVVFRETGKDLGSSIVGMRRIETELMPTSNTDADFESCVSFDDSDVGRLGDFDIIIVPSEIHAEHRHLYFDPLEALGNWPLPPLACCDGRDLDVASAKAKISGSWGFLRDGENDCREREEWLSQGGSLFAASCAQGNNLHEQERGAIACFLNRSYFADEWRDNEAPVIDMSNGEQAGKYIFILTKGMYAVPGLRSASVTAEQLASEEYQAACQPSDTKVWPERETEESCFKITKTIIPWLWSMTLEFRVSEIPEAERRSLAPLADGLHIHKALLLERQNADKDMTAKAKSILLYHDLPDKGCVVTNITAVVNSSLPALVAKVVDSTMSATGTKELAENAVKARAYFR